MDEKTIEKIEKPMDNYAIKKYLPDAKIKTTKDLNNIHNIDELFDKKNFIDYVILLYLDEENSGHWVALLKYDDYIEFFDSYGGSPEQVYNYCPKQKRQRLGTDNNRLCQLLNKCPYKVVYNGVKFQENNKSDYDVNTCGRHCCFRVINLLGKGYILPQYIEYMNYAKNYYKEPYDIIVSKLINM